MEEFQDTIGDDIIGAFKYKNNDKKEFQTWVDNIKAYKMVFIIPNHMNIQFEIKVPKLKQWYDKYLKVLQYVPPVKDKKEKEDDDKKGKGFGLPDP